MVCGLLQRLVQLAGQRHQLAVGRCAKDRQPRDRKQSELLAHLFDTLKAAHEPNGTSLFDHTCIAYGSNIQSIHYLDNCPTLIAGGGAGIKLGEHFVLSDPKTPLCNLWLTLLRGAGIKAVTHGDSTRIIDEIAAV
ncbi:MAG: hypothetical protein JNM18_23665 [Planctomycetaceae bacterium]|nr:hypothetical protein [Planctomycetaceae bacterium]